MVMGRERVERWSVRKTVARGENGIVASQHYVAAQAGAVVLEKGGNAVDAAVTAGFLLQTVEPWMSGLSACGYMLVAEPDGTVHAVEFTGRAPSLLDRAAYAPDPGGAKTFLGMPAAVDGANVRGYSAVVIPGAVRGLSLALARFGTLAFDEALRPAIDRARHGLTIDWHATLAIALAEADLRRDPAARAMFLPGDAPPEPGEVLPLTALAATLERLAEAGPDDFYGGRIAERLAADLEAGGSAITPYDLSAYRTTVAPAECEEIAGRIVHVAGETSGGRRLLETLRHFDRAYAGRSLDLAFYRAMVEALRSASAAHGERNRAADLLRAASTTHVNAVDGEGRMAALTFTLLNRFGARIVSPSTGILLNNGMAWFDLAPDRLNSLEAGAPGRNNMCPVAITDGDGPFAVLGASGGNQIVPALTQIAAMLLHLDLHVETALNAPRLHAGPSAEIILDSEMGQDVADGLADLGPIRFAERGVYPRPFASPSATSRRGGRFEGMPDTTYPASEAVAAAPRGPAERGAAR
jgi:gamma-glutamyltranspeptidase / glutathione hydrolase